MVCDPTLELPLPRFFGVWRDSTVSGPETLKTFGTWADFLTFHQQADASLVDIETFIDDSRRYFAGLWQTGPAGYQVTKDFGMAAFQTTRLAKEAAGLGLTDLEVFIKPDGTRVFLAVWKPGAVATEVLFAASEADFEAQFWAETGTHVLIDFETWFEDARRFVGVYRPKTPDDGLQKLALSQNWCDFHVTYHDLGGEFRLDDLEFYDVERRYYAGVFSEAEGDDHLWVGYRETGEYGFVDAHDQMLFSDSAIRLRDFDMSDDGTPEVDDQTYLLHSSGGWLNGGSFGGFEELADDGGPIINSSPVLHDTGSLGPD